MDERIDHNEIDNTMYVSGSGLSGSESSPFGQSILTHASTLVRTTHASTTTRQYHNYVPLLYESLINMILEFES